MLNVGEPSSYSVRHHLGNYIYTRIMVPKLCDVRRAQFGGLEVRTGLLRGRLDAAC